MLVISLLIPGIAVALLLSLLIREEWKYRALTRHIRDTRGALEVMAHELRTPLTRLRGESSLLRKESFGKLKFSQLESINRIEGATADAIAIVHRILAFSRIEEGQMMSHAVDIDLRSSITAAMNAVRGLNDTKKHTIRMDLGKSPMVVHADPLQLHGIFDALISNAIVYTPEGGRIGITIRPQGANAVVTVEDSGIGIPFDERKRLFEIFFRGKKARTLYFGAGLSLALAEQFARAMNGHISLGPRRKKGAIFIVKLPLSSSVNRTIA